MDKKYRVENKNKFAVGISLENPKREQNILPGSFAKLSEDDIAYIDSVSTLFSRGMLCVDDSHINELLGYVEVNPNIISDEEIKKILKGNQKTMLEQLNTITELHARNRVLIVLKEVGKDLSVGKIKALKEFFGKELFLDEIEG